MSVGDPLSKLADSWPARQRQQPAGETGCGRVRRHHPGRRRPEAAGIGETHHRRPDAGIQPAGHRPGGDRGGMPAGRRPNPNPNRRARRCRHPYPSRGGTSLQRSSARRLSGADRRSRPSGTGSDLAARPGRRTRRQPIVAGEIRGPATDASALGIALAEELLGRGAGEILQRLL
jgi:hypothetical protein